MSVSQVLLIALLAVLTGYFLTSNPNGIPDSFELFPRPPPPTTIPLCNDDTLKKTKIYVKGGVPGAESIAIDGKDRIFTSTSRGDIVIVDLERNQTMPFVRIGGQLLHLFIPRGSNIMYVADATRGLLRVDLDTKEMRILVTEADGLPIATCNNIDVAKDGTVYFSDATRVPTLLTPTGRYDSYHAAVLTVMSGMPYGRVIRYDPKSGEAKTIYTGAIYANGVALSKNEDFLVLSDSGARGLRKIWLTPEKLGQWEWFIQGLAAYPDNLNSASDGGFWLALVNPVSKLVEAISPCVWVKKILTYLPVKLVPIPSPFAMIIKLDENGTIVRCLRDMDRSVVPSVTDVFENDRKLFMASIKSDYVGVLDLKDVVSGK